MTKIEGFSCIRCGATYPGDIDIDSRGCPACQAAAPANLQPIYARKPYVSPDSAVGGAAGKSLWRFASMLPCSAEEAVSLGEGQTPLIAAARMGRLLGTPKLSIKDEGRNPTWSHKDRFSTVAVSVARARGARVVATASSGNAGASLAAYAARAGLDCVVATFAGSAGPMLSQIRKYGATVLPLVNKRDRWTLLQQAVSRFGWFVTSPYHAPVVGSHPLGIEGYKTIAYEIVEQSDGRAPNWCVVPVCYGDALAGLWSGFKDLYDAGVIDRLPRLVAAEVHGSLADALAHGLDHLEERDIQFDTLAVSIGTPRSAYQALKALRESSGHAVPVTNDGLVEMQQRLARSEGIFAELASVTPCVAIENLRKRNVISPDDHVVAIVTASGLKDLDRSVDPDQHSEVFQTTDDAWRWLNGQKQVQQRAS
ncbi:L-threonine synthase [Mesorhizobium albiziae]|uniref:L-threonine synthase n=1 Tax=Neomesorhizobium albiziae TaxID=335020 RepID=A0A1I4EEH3_9HYPH|nr:threonine synthase [Mesorhizobium albiziae]GLS33551.1 threonine synthase [Mesorhizobium albiziae]SFL03390.1 L-threonine synthase [Mesorhizobium albiziae]